VTDFLTDHNDGDEHAIHRYQLYRDGLDDHRAAEGYDVTISPPRFGGPPLFSIGLAAAVANVTLEVIDQALE